MTPEQIDALLAQAVAVARRGPTAKVGKTDRRIVRDAVEAGRRRLASPDATRREPE